MTTQHSESEQPLPQVYLGDLDTDKLDELLTDLVGCATVHEVLIKRAAMALVDERERPTLEQGFDALRTGGIRALQVRYSVQGVQWLDTLRRTPEGFALVRIQGFTERETG